MEIRWWALDAGSGDHPKRFEERVGMPFAEGFGNLGTAGTGV